MFFQLLFKLFRRPDLAELDQLQRKLYKTQVQLGDEITAHRETFASLCRSYAQQKAAEKALNDTIRERIDRQLRQQHIEFERYNAMAQASLGVGLSGNAQRAAIRVP